MSRLLASPRDVRALEGVRLCAVGPATAERLARYGLKVDLDAARVPRRSAVRMRWIAQVGDVNGLKVLLPRADIGREVIAEELRRQGADVTEVVAYRTVAIEPEREGEPDIYRMLLERTHRRRHLHEPSAVRSFVRHAGRGAGGGPAPDDRRGLDRAGDGGGRGAVRHPHDDRARRSTPCRRWSMPSRSTFEAERERCGP